MRRQFLVGVLLSTIASITLLQKPMIALPDQIPTALVVRLIDLPVYGNAKLFLDRLPPGFPKDVSLPQNAKLLASVTYLQGKVQMVVLDYPDRAQAIKQHYTKQLEAQGWKRDRDSEESEKSDETAIFRLWKNQTSVTVTALPNINQAGSRVRVSVTAEPGSFDPKERFAEMRQNRSFLDNLTRVVRNIPQGELQTLSGGGTTGQFRETLLLKTKLSRDEVIRQFDLQTSIEKWERRSVGHQGALSWSYWQQRDPAGQLWQGTLQMVETAPQQYIIRSTAVLSQEDSGSSNLPDDPTNPKTLPRSIALRLINANENSEIFVGEPSSLPGQIPLPNLSIVGGKTTPQSAYVLFDNASSENSLPAYQNQLIAAGWKLSDIGQEERAGFVSNRQLLTTFCQGESKVLSLYQFDSFYLHLIANLESYEYSPCKVDKSFVERQMEREKRWESIPALKLTPPSRSFVRSSGSTVQPSTFAEFQGAIETSLAMNDLAKHYESQFTSAGWKSIVSDGNDQIRQSVWRLDRNGEKWQALLTFIQSSTNPKQHQADLSIERLDMNREKQ